VARAGAADVAVRIGPDGRVYLRGAVLFDGYADQPALTASVLLGGELRTPDLGRVDRDGRLQVLGRADDVVVSGGVNVPLSAVERRILEHPEVADAAVVGAPDPEWGSIVVVVVVPADARTVELAELRDFVGACFPREWCPRELVVVDRLPMLESGKVDRQALTRDLTGAARG
jgi:O-succinylbenzoic acid--CoA ligase